MQRLLTLLLLLLTLGPAAEAADTLRTESGRAYIVPPKTYRFRVQFTNKRGTPYSLRRPGEFLSQRALARRARMGIKVDQHDLPITPAYLQALRERGLALHVTSKWNNTAVVETSDTLLVTALASGPTALPFVSGVRRVWESQDTVWVKDHSKRAERVTKYLQEQNDSTRLHSITWVRGKTDPDSIARLITSIVGEEEEVDTDELKDMLLTLDSMTFTAPDELANQTPGERSSLYGRSLHQVQMTGADSLHLAGFRGDGVLIAVIDGGFYNADVVPGLQDIRLQGTRNFVHPHGSIYEESTHGTMVLSCIAAHERGHLVGTAPEASFLLLQSEENETEQMVEEDNWVAAAEYADSLGADVLTSSLGYYHFDDKRTNHTYAELDGLTAANSRAASLCASRGLLALNSAGNEGDNHWKKIGFPADARDILAVGALQPDSLNTTFSSLGHSADGRVKPDVMAQGGDCRVYNVDSSIIEVNGTSFSCPILCGAVACLVQTFPTKRPEQIIRAVQRSASRADQPDSVFGYGIANVWRAYQLLK